MLHSDVILYSDGGGKVRAALNPIYGADRVSRFLVGIEKQGSTAGLRAEIAEVNGELGALIYKGREIIHVVSLQLDEYGSILNIFLVSNPDKLPDTSLM